MRPLEKDELLTRLLDAVRSSGYQAIVLASEHPFLIRVFKNDSPPLADLRVYIWNCTHGGKSRAEDEYRVQLTGVVPERRRNEIPLVLGWHEESKVFVAFDIEKHAGQASASPSIQIKKAAILEASERGIAAYDRSNGEIAIAFRPALLVEYARLASRLHKEGRDKTFLKLLNEASVVTDSEIEEIKGSDRRILLTQVRRRFREADFRRRVLSAYEARCAMCEVQLGLVEAAHILPVADTESTDSTSNGVGLCGLHHVAFDQALVSFNEKYKIEVSSNRLASLSDLGLKGGKDAFLENLRKEIILPAKTADLPDPRYVRRGREIRFWRP